MLTTFTVGIPAPFDNCFHGNLFSFFAKMIFKSSDEKLVGYLLWAYYTINDICFASIITPFRVDFTGKIFLL